MRHELQITHSELVRDAAPLLVLEDDTAEATGLRPGMLATLTVDRATVPVWVDVRSRQKRAKSLPQGPAGFASRLVCRYLGLPREKRSFAAILDVASAVSLRAQAAIAGDLPPSDTIDVAANSLPSGASESEWFIAFYDGISAPVRVRIREVPAGAARTTLAFRVLMAMPAAGGEILLSRLELNPFHTLNRHGATDAARLGFAARTRNVGSRITEAAFARLLGAPQIAMRAVPALVGDDVARVVRLPPSAFPLLGLEPGGRVVVQWATRGVVAVALEAGEASANEELELIRSARESGGIDHQTGTSYRATVRHLRVRLTAGLRADLGVPRMTVVTVRRSLPPLVAAQLQLLAIPLAGILIAVFAVEAFQRWWMVAVTVSVSVILVLAPLRRTWPRRGSW